MIEAMLDPDDGQSVEVEKEERERKATSTPPSVSTDHHHPSAKAIHQSHLIQQVAALGRSTSS